MLVTSRFQVKLVQRGVPGARVIFFYLDGRLWAKHVYGHTGHTWNERADELAERGKGGAPANARRGVGNGGVGRQGGRGDG